MIKLEVTVYQPGDPTPFDDEPGVRARSVVEWGKGHPLRQIDPYGLTDEQRALVMELGEPGRVLLDLLASERNGLRYLVRRVVPGPDESRLAELHAAAAEREQTMPDYADPPAEAAERGDVVDAMAPLQATSAAWRGDGGYAEDIARHFHYVYERLAPANGYETRKETAKPWEDVPANNKALMIATVDDLLASRVIRPGGERRRPVHCGQEMLEVHVCKTFRTEMMLADLPQPIQEIAGTYRCARCTAKLVTRIEEPASESSC